MARTNVSNNNNNSPAANVPPKGKGNGKGKTKKNVDAEPKPTKPKVIKEITKMSFKNKVCVYFGIWLIGQMKENGLVSTEENPRDIITNLIPVLNSEDEAEKGKFFDNLEKDLKKMNTKKAIEKERKDAEKAALKAQKEAAKAAEKEAKAAERAAKAAERAEQRKNAPKTKKATTKKERINKEVDELANNDDAADVVVEQPKKKRNNKKKAAIDTEEDIIAELEKRIPANETEEKQPEPEPELTAAPVEEAPATADQELAEEEIIEENEEDYEEFKFAGLQLMKHKVTNFVLKMNDNEEYEELGLYVPEHNHIIDENGEVIMQDEQKKTKKAAAKKGAK